MPIPFADSAVLMPLQSGMVLGILKIYDIKNEGGNLNNISDAILSSGFVTVAAKTIISGLKAVPGLDIATAAIDTVVAAVFTAAIGGITINIAEKIAKGELNPNDLDWIKKFMDTEFAEKVGKYITKLGKSFEGKNSKNIGKIAANFFKEFSK